MKILSKNYKNQNLNLDIFIDFSDEETIYLNATKTAKAFGKDLSNWRRSSQTIEYIKEIEKTFNSVNFTELELIVTKQGKFGGTWIHKSLIIMFARWLDSNFAVWCDLQIEEILKSKNSEFLKTSQQSFDLDSYILENEKLIKLVKLITSENTITLHYLDKLTKQLNLKSPLELLQIDLN